jgi:TolB-like protein/Tfp pilus assembly protein PilF/predicted Ser/Thr protein kinase
MKCPKCHSENPPESSYCGKCATRLDSAAEPLAGPTETLQTPREELTTGSTFAGRYQVIEELGHGGMGRVYKVHDTKIGEKIALKLIRPEIASNKETIGRFSNEMRLARRISHRNVCRMFDIGEAEGAHFITMEYVHGEDLKSMIEMSGSLSQGMLLNVGKQICGGLAEAHRLGVVHRDLKPRNIMIDKHGNAKIMDFGIARSLREKGITGAGVMVGTPEYMSPEQAEAIESDQRSDIYSLGVILYEMATSRVPFTGETALSIAMKHKGEVPQDPRLLNPQIPDELSGVILKCLEKDKAKRYQSVSDVSSALERIEKGIPTTERIEPSSRTTTTKGATVTLKRRWVFLASAVLILLLTALAVFIRRGIEGKRGAIPKRSKMLVVLPFENLGPIEDEYFADGMTDEITNRLSALYGLGVISRSSAGQYKKTTKPTRQIREELNVDYILGGTVRWDREAGKMGRARITPYLVRTEDDTQIWSSTYEQAVEDTFAIQTRIAENVIRQLDLTILEPERRILEARPTSDAEAYDYFLRANALGAIDALSLKECERAIAMYERAIRLDPGFVQAYVTLSRFHTSIYHAGIDRTAGRLARSKAAVDKALELAPDMPEAKEALAYYYYQGYLDYERALEILESVRKARPNNPLSLTGFILRRQGKWVEALGILEQTLKFNPRDSGAAWEIGLTHFCLRQYEDTELWGDRALSLDPRFVQGKADKARSLYYRKGTTEEARALVNTLPPGPWSNYLGFMLEMADRDWKEALEKLDSFPQDDVELFALEYFYKDLGYAFAYSAQHDLMSLRRYADRARAALEKLVGENPGDPRYHSSLGLAYAYLGRKDEAIREGSQAVDLYPVSRDAFKGPTYVVNLARIYAITGDHEKAIDTLEYLLSIPAGYYISLRSIRKDPAWNPLREEPRFKKLVE